MLDSSCLGVVRKECGADGVKDGSKEPVVLSL